MGKGEIKPDDIGFRFQIGEALINLELGFPIPNQTIGVLDGGEVVPVGGVAVVGEFFDGECEFFGFSFLRTLLETGLETGSMQIHSDCGSVTVFLALERGEIVSARLNANPLLSMDDVLQFLLQNTPGAYRFEFIRNRAQVHQANAI